MDFRLNPSYPTEYCEAYDSALLPFWREPVEAVLDPTVSEVAILKATQSGGTENVILNAVRYHVAENPLRILYISGDQKSAEEDFRERIKGGLLCSAKTAERMRTARDVECRLDFPDMTIAAAWPKNRQAFKRNPWSVIFADEFSTYPDLTPGMIRKRCDTVPFHHIVWLSSPDPAQKRPSSEDPIFIEFLAGDRREWYMPDPSTGEMFHFEMGTRESLYGLKWPQDAKRDDGTWDLERVRSEAYYVTPSGTRIENRDKPRIVASGQWQPHSTQAPAWRRSYRVTSFLLPFRSGDLGNIAVAFLEAQALGPRHLKVFVYEYLAEPWASDRESAEEDTLFSRVGDYAKGSKISESDKYKGIYIARQKLVLVAVDVQKNHHWQLAREWIEGGDSGLISYASGASFEDIDALVEQTKATQVFMDVGYEARAFEVYEYCLDRGGYPTLGNDKLALPYKKNIIDPFEGKVGQGQVSIARYTFNADIFKTLLMDMLRGESERIWHVYQGIEREYIRQVASEERVDGQWVLKRGHSQNHLWDCEVLQVLGATVYGMCRHEWLGKNA